MIFCAICLILGFTILFTNGPSWTAAVLFGVVIFRAIETRIQRRHVEEKSEADDQIISEDYHAGLEELRQNTITEFESNRRV